MTMATLQVRLARVFNDLTSARESAPGRVKVSATPTQATTGGNTACEFQ